MQTYSLQDLATELGYSKGLVRKYITIGILPPAEGAGRARYYTARHMALIRELREELTARDTLSLSAIRRRLNPPRTIKVSPR